MLGGTPKPQRKPETQAGRFTLTLGDQAGTTIVAEAQAGETQPIAEALAKARRELDAPQNHMATLGRDAAYVSGAMRKVQEVLDRFTEIAEGRIDAETLGKWADELIGWQKRLNPDEHWQERLRVLRTLVVLLALLGRWFELSQSLADALQVATRLGDEGARGWVMHELGTLHLAAEQHAEADDDLSQALRLRAQAKDAEGVKATEANLRVLCKMLRSRLHQDDQDEPVDDQLPLGPTDGEPTTNVIRRLLPSPPLLLALGFVFLTVGGVAGASISGGLETDVRRVAVVIEPVPATPEVGEPVAFRAVVRSRGDPNHYSWLFGDGEGTHSASPTHIYLQPGRYTVTVAANGPGGIAVGATCTVMVRPRSSPRRAVNKSTTRTIVIKKHPNKPTHTHKSTHTHKLTHKHAHKPVAKSVKPVFISPTGAKFVAGTRERFLVIATGNPIPKITESGALPSGMSFAGGTLRGAPTTVGAFPLTFTATNGAGAARQSFTLTVERRRPTVVTTTTTRTTTRTKTTTRTRTVLLPAEFKPIFTSPQGATFKYGQEEEFLVTANGEPAPTISLEGKLPEGVKFDKEALVGAAREAGTFTLQFTASNKAGSTIQTFVLTVVEG